MNIDPNIAALLGAGGGNDQFTQMLMRSINPNVSGDLQNNIGAPNINPLMSLANSPPPITRADPQPALAGPQMLQSLGFGMAAAAGKPGSTGLSALGEGGKDVLSAGGAASQRAIQEAQQENQAAIQEWNDRSKSAEDVLAAQMKEPELDQKMLDLTGQSLARDATRQDTAAYRAGLLENNAAKTGISQQNANTAGVRAQTGQERAGTYDQSVQDRAAANAQAAADRAAALDQKATQFQQKLMTDSAARGSRIGIQQAQAAAIEFKNEMTLRKNPITGELPDEATQQALRDSLTAKYASAARTGAGGSPGSITTEDTLAQAKAAIAAGADPVAVKKRIIGMGIDPAGLGI